MKNEQVLEQNKTDADRADNLNKKIFENSANGLDSETVTGSQGGRNERGIASTDMDSKNGILRMGDTSNSTLEVTQKGADTAASEGQKTNTAMVDVTTAGPDDYASADQVPTPKAQEAAKKQSDARPTRADKEAKAQAIREEDVAETGTDLNNKPTY